MCGGSDDSAPAIIYTKREYNIGLNIFRVERLADGQIISEYAMDNLVRPNACFGSHYTRPLTEADVDETRLTIQGAGRVALEAQALINDRKEYMRKEAEKAQGKERKCVIL
jgi:hypothetical protein